MRANGKGTCRVLEWVFVLILGPWEIPCPWVGLLLTRSSLDRSRDDPNGVGNFLWWFGRITLVQ
jgi:hypothetical protein